MTTEQMIGFMNGDDSNDPKAAVASIIAALQAAEEFGNQFDHALKGQYCRERTPKYVKEARKRYGEACK